MAKTTIRVLTLLASLGAAAAGWGAAEEVVCADAKFAFTPPSDAWQVNTALMQPVAATLVNSELNARITINYSDYELYKFKIDYGFLKGQLEKNEKYTFKPTKPNYNRVSLDDRKFPFGKTARLEFTTFDELGYHHTVVYAIANGTVVYFASAESLEREWPKVDEDFEKLIASLRFTP